MRRIIHAITAAFDLGDDADVHITLLRQFLLSEFFFATRGSYSVTCGFRDILRLFCHVGVGACAGAGAGVF